MIKNILNKFMIRNIKNKYIFSSTNCRLCFGGAGDFFVDSVIVIVTKIIITLFHESNKYYTYQINIKKLIADTYKNLTKLYFLKQKSK